MSSNEVSSSSLASNTDKGSNNNPTSLLNGVNGDANSISSALSVHSSNSTRGSGSDVTSVSMSGGNSGQTVDQNMFMAQPTMSYSHFAAPVDGSWTPTAFDPSLMTAFGFTGAGMMSGQTLPNTAPGYFYPGTAADLAGGIWGQDSSAAAANSLMLSSFLMGNPLSMDQQQQIPGSDMMSLDPMIGLGQNFGNMAVNGSPMANLMQMSGTTSGNTTGLASGQSVSTGVPSPTVGSSVEDSTAQISTSSAPASTQVQSSAPQPEKPKSWAAIASQPAKPRPPPAPKVQPVENDSPPTGSKKTGAGPRGMNGSNQGGHRPDGHSFGKGSTGGRGRTQQTQASGEVSVGTKSNSKSASQSELVGKLKSENKYNPSELTLNTSNARFFVIKSYAEDDIHRSIKYSIWTSTDHGNRRLDQAYRDQKGKGGVYLFFSVNGSGHFCGMAQMVSEVDFNTVTGVWAQDKWKGSFKVKWIYVKDVPNNQLRHIRLENNENKPVTNSRDTQEVPLAKARQVIKIVHAYQHTTSIFDDFDHYEKKQEEDSKGT